MNTSAISPTLIHSVAYYFVLENSVSIVFTDWSSKNIKKELFEDFRAANEDKFLRVYFSANWLYINIEFLEKITFKRARMNVYEEDTLRSVLSVNIISKHKIIQSTFLEIGELKEKIPLIVASNCDIKFQSDFSPNTLLKIGFTEDELFLLMSKSI